MMLRLTVLLLCVAAGCSAAAGPTRTPTEAATHSEDDGRHIRLIRYEAWPGEPTYTLTLHSDGTVAYEGFTRAAVVGRRSWSVPPARFGALREDLLGLLPPEQAPPLMCGALLNGVTTLLELEDGEDDRWAVVYSFGTAYGASSPARDLEAFARALDAEGESGLRLGPR